MLIEIKYELERVLISKESKKIGFILIMKSPGQARPQIWASQHLGSADRHFSCANRHSKSAEWLSWVPAPRLSFGLIWTTFLRIFKSRIVRRRVFNLHSKN